MSYILTFLGGAIGGAVAAYVYYQKLAARMAAGVAIADSLKKTL